MVNEADGVLVFLQLRRHQTAALVEKRKEVFCLGFHRLAQVLGQHRVVAGKVDALHDLFVTLVNLKYDARVAVAIVGVDAGGDADAAEVAVLIKRDHGLAGLFNLLFAEAVADLESELFAQAIRRHFNRAFNQDLGHHGAALHQNDDLDAIALRFGEDAHVGHIASGEESLHIVLRRALRIGVSDLRFEVGHDPLPADGFGTDVLDHDRADNRTGRGCHLGRGLGQEGKQQQKKGKEADSHEVAIWWTDGIGRIRL